MVAIEVWLRATTSLMTSMARRTWPAPIDCSPTAERICSTTVVSSSMA
jgi:hypothetical protein